MWRWRQSCAMAGCRCTSRRSSNDVYANSLSNAKPGFAVLQGVVVNITNDLEAGLQPIKEMLLVSRMGFEAAANEIQDHYLAGWRKEAVAAVPDQLADEIALVGPVDRIRDRLQAWRETPVTSLLVSARNPAQLGVVADLVLGA